MDGQTREGEAFGLKPNQTERHGREARRVFSREENTKPRQSLNNITTGVREREDTNRTREAGNRDEVEGVVANTLKLFRDGAIGFIDWLGGGVSSPWHVRGRRPRASLSPEESRIPSRCRQSSQ